ncbi:aromatase/cyclase [Kitasatospora sp. NPDC085879]|uniref:aromatase/cyclase n=1 Tax=Kitasatospora sp. NPDC085879 TaxID=3154769 RepID=UPI0034411C0C
MEPSTGRAAAAHHTEHRIEVAAPVDTVYGLVADVTGWPRVFGPTIHAEQLELDGRTERIRLWATANGAVKTWVSRRELDPDARRIAFRQEVSQSPVASMGGEWILEPLPDGRTSVLLTHDYTAVDDVPDAEQWIAQAVDRNSNAELAALRGAAEAAAGAADLDGLELTFADTVEIDGPADAVRDFLYQAQEWEKRLPHVSRVVLREDTPGLQHLEMDTVAKDGSTHTTASVRVLLADGRLVYKQLVLPPLLSLHLGCWTLTTTPDGTVAATSEHTIRINPERLALLGEGTTVADAKAYVRTALGTNSTATLMHAKAYAEGTARD